MKSKIEVTRTHDIAIYLDEDRYEKPKELFKFITNYAINKWGQNYFENKKLIDVGCATGEFLYHVNKVMPGNELIGVDVVPELLEKAKNNLPSNKFILGSVLESDTLESNCADVNFLIGVHSIFDEFETCLMNLINWTKPSGLVYLVGTFNPNPIDVLIKYQMSSARGINNVYESGWNLFSMESVSNFLAQQTKVKNFCFEKFEITIELPKQKDLVRAYTLNYNSQKILTNGLCLLIPIYLLEVELY